MSAPRAQKEFGLNKDAGFVTAFVSKITSRLGRCLIRRFGRRNIISRSRRLAEDIFSSWLTIGLSINKAGHKDSG